MIKVRYYDATHASAICLWACQGSIREKACSIPKEDHRFAEKDRGAVLVATFGCAVGNDNVIRRTIDQLSNGQALHGLENSVRPAKLSRSEMPGAVPDQFVNHPPALRRVEGHCHIWNGIGIEMPNAQIHIKTVGRGAKTNSVRKWNERSKRSIAFPQSNTACF